jgi:amidase
MLSRRELLRSVAAASVISVAPSLAFGSDLADYGADGFELCSKLRRAEISAEDVVGAAIRNLVEVQDKLNLAVTMNFEGAASAARARVQGALAGLPILAKDLADVEGLPTRFGSRSRFGVGAASHDDPFIAKLRQAGAIVIAKSATSEFGLLPTTEPLAFGPTRNPWDLSRSAGGSSGGAAAAVAAGVVPIAHGSDGGGSIRIPASCCGVFGFKPSRPKRSNLAVPSALDLAVDHVLTRSVRDSAMAFALTRGGSSAVVPSSSNTAKSRLRRLKIGVLTNGWLGRPPALPVASALGETERLVRGLGHGVVPVGWPVDERQFAADFLLLWGVGAKHATERQAQVLKDGAPAFEPLTMELARRTDLVSAQDMGAAIARLEQVPARYSAWFEANGLDAVLSPVTAWETPRIGELSSSIPPGQLIERLLEYVAFTPLHNVAGAPAMSVPLCRASHGLPMGMMFAARAGDDEMLFQLAFELEQARPWAKKVPPIHASRSLDQA